MNFINDEKYSTIFLISFLNLYTMITYCYLLLLGKLQFFCSFLKFLKICKLIPFFHFVHFSAFIFISPKMARRCKSAVMQSQKFLQKMVPPQFKSLTQARSVFCVFNLSLLNCYYKSISTNLKKKHMTKILSNPTCQKVSLNFLLNSHLQ